MIKYFSFLLLLFGFLNHSVAFAQTKPQFKHLKVENGLSQSGVLSMVQDKMGFMWFGTRDGLNKYDTQKFQIFKHSDAKHSLSSSINIYALLNDSKGNLWVGTQNGLNLYNPQSNTFRHFLHDKNNKESISNSVIRNIYEDKKGALWIATDSGLNKMNEDFKFQHFFKESGKAEGLSGNKTKVIYEDNEGLLWVGTTNGLTKIYYRNRQYHFKNYRNIPGNPSSLPNNDITSIVQDKNFNLWIGTHYGGFALFNRNTETFKNFVHQENNVNGLTSNYIRKIVVNKDGKLWIATYKGINIYDPLSDSFRVIKYDYNDFKSLSNNSVYDIFIDKVGTIWIGTYYGGINILYSNSTPFRIYQEKYPLNSISGNIVRSIVNDKEGNLWIGTEGEGLNHFIKATGEFIYYKNNVLDKHSLSSNSVKAISINKTGEIWVGTHEGGLDRFNKSSNNFTHYQADLSDSMDLNSHNIIALLNDSQGRFWAGTEDKGLYLFNGKKFVSLVKIKGKFQINNISIKDLFEDSKHNIWVSAEDGLNVLKYKSTTFKSFNSKYYLKQLGTNNINSVAEDAKGKIWISTYDQGVISYDEKSDTFKKFTIDQGLPSNNVFGLLQDNESYYWLSTDNGLVKFNGKSFKTYTIEDGLPGNVFNNNAYLKDNRGVLYFGGYNGMVSFLPDSIKDNSKTSPVVFTGLKLFNKVVNIGDSTGLLTQNINLTNKITFNYDQNIFTIDFAVLNYIKSEKNKYAYKLEGFQKDWNNTDIPSVTFTNLPAGTYNLLVKGSNNDGVWSSPISLIINVKPPFWETWWAYLFYSVVIVAILIITVRYLLIRERLKKEHDLHQMKLDFFTNVSHEIRTPLTLILGPLENLIKQTEDYFSVNRQLLTIKNNASRLSRLVNELMDFRKAESGNLKLHVTENNIISFAKEIYLSFQYLALQHHIRYDFKAPENDILIYFDTNQLEKVLYNLLSNAFKFSPDNGHIELKIIEEKQILLIKIKDSGKGIAKENRAKLFSNFYQIEDPSFKRNVGTGIGLALSKKIANLHHGDVYLEDLDNEDEGSCFVLQLQKGRSHFKSQEIVHGTSEKDDEQISQYQIPDETFDNTEEESSKQDKEYTILVVEDNLEVRNFIGEFLINKYQIILAENGVVGFNEAITQIPDLIISDVMMPEMDGLELCRKLKTDDRTSHIPVILLTARSGNIHQVSGLKTGADIYLNKPFSIEVLLLNVNNLLKLRDKLRKKFTQQMVFEPTNVIIESNDQEFLNRAMKILEANFDNSEFGVNNLAAEVGMSTPILYKKIKSLTGQSVNNFIKTLKLKRAAQLLKQGKYTVNEIAYQVGFSGSKYFSKEFIKQFGVSPSEYKQDD